MGLSARRPAPAPDEKRQAARLPIRSRAIISIIISTFIRKAWGLRTRRARTCACASPDEERDGGSGRLWKPRGADPAPAARRPQSRRVLRPGQAMAGRPVRRAGRASSRNERTPDIVLTGTAAEADMPPQIAAAMARKAARSGRADDPPRPPGRHRRGRGRSSPTIPVRCTWPMPCAFPSWACSARPIRRPRPPSTRPRPSSRKDGSPAGPASTVNAPTTTAA